MHSLYRLITPLLLLIAVNTTGFAASSKEGSAEGEQYIAIDPPLVVNIVDGSTLHFLQVTAQFKVTTPEAAAAIQTHISLIRHTLLLLLGEQQIRDVYTTRGKEKLRQKCIEEIKVALKDYTDTNSIENIYFTGFIVQ